MITKQDVYGTEDTVDWEAVRKATEIPRTYFVTTSDGRQFFKMYKSDEAKEIFERKNWTGKIVSRKVT